MKEKERLKSEQHNQAIRRHHEAMKKEAFTHQCADLLDELKEAEKIDRLRNKILVMDYHVSDHLIPTVGSLAELQQ